MITQPISPKFGAPCRSGHTQPLSLMSVKCCICDRDDAEPIAVGEDFEYRTSPDTFLAVRCRRCGLVYLNPRPMHDELLRLYPPDYRAFRSAANRQGWVGKLRRRAASRRLLDCCKGLSPQARMIEIGCGDGFHLGLLQEFGQPGWQLEGVNSGGRTVNADSRNLHVHQGAVQDLDLPQGSYDLALMIATIEYLDNPSAVLSAVRSLLKPGGRVVIVTDSTDTLNFQLFKIRHWGGYHFPRCRNLFNPDTMQALANKTRLEIETLTTVGSPVNWIYSIRNTLVDWQAPLWLIQQFSLNSPISLGILTLFDRFCQATGKGALMWVILKRPAQDI